MMKLEVLESQDAVRRSADSGAEARLAEADGGWTLTVTVGASDLAAAANLADSAPSEIELAPLVVSVSPNLVPGDPFVVERLRLVVLDDRDDAAAREGVGGK